MTYRLHPSPSDRRPELAATRHIFRSSLLLARVISTYAISACAISIFTLAGCNSDPEKPDSKNTDKANTESNSPAQPPPLLISEAAPNSDGLNMASSSKASSSETNNNDSTSLPVATAAVNDIEVVVGEARGTSAEEFQGSVYVILYNQQGDMVSSEGDLQLSYSGDASTVKSKTIRLAPSAFKVQRIPGEEDDTLAALVDSFPGTLGKTLEVEGKFDSRLTSESELEFGSSFEESDSDAGSEAESDADVETEGEDSDDAETVR